MEMARVQTILGPVAKELNHQAFGSGRGTIGRDDRQVSQALIAFERSKDCRRQSGAEERGFAESDGAQRRRVIAVVNPYEDGFVIRRGPASVY